MQRPSRRLSGQVLVTKQAPEAQLATKRRALQRVHDDCGAELVRSALLHQLSTGRGLSAGIDPVIHEQDAIASPQAAASHGQF